VEDRGSSSEFSYAGASREANGDNAPDGRGESAGTRMTGSGTADDPLVLRTPPGTAEFQMHRDDTADPPELVCQVGSTKLRYLARCLEHNPRNNRVRA
jgi:hypothetical protein